MNKQYIDFLMTKLTFTALICVPVLTVVRQFYLFNLFGWLQIACLSYIIIFAGYKLYRLSAAVNAIKTGTNMPRFYEEHPIYNPDPNHYKNLIKKVRDFTQSIQEGKLALIKLSADDINTLRLRGKTPCKAGSFGLPEYYEIIEDKVVIKSLIFYPFSLEVFLPFLNEIRFILKEGEIQEVNDITCPDVGLKKSKSITSFSPLSKSTLLERILMSNEDLFSNESNISSIVNSINYVDVVSDQLILSNQTIESFNAH
jgi:hypothetical protein